MRGILSSLAMVSLTGCTQKELVYPAEKTTVEVRFNWDLAPEATPSGMTVYFFPISQESKIWRYDIPGRDGGVVEIPSGKYSLVAFNNDLSGVECIDASSFGNISAENTFSYPNDAYMSTGYLFATHLPEIRISRLGVAYVCPDGRTVSDVNRVIECQPDTLCTSYQLLVEDIDHPERIRSATARLNGVAQSIRIASGKRSESSICIGFGLHKSLSEDLRNILSGECCGLGTPDVTTPSFTIAIRITGREGKTAEKIFDMTDQVLSAPNPRNVLMRIPRLEVPDMNPDSDIGIGVGVDGWESVETDYEIWFPGGF